MKATCFSEKYVDFQRATWRHIPEDRTLVKSTCFKSSCIVEHQIIRNGALIFLVVWRACCRQQSMVECDVSNMADARAGVGASNTTWRVTSCHNSGPRDTIWSELERQLVSIRASVVVQFSLGVRAELVFERSGCSYEWVFGPSSSLQRRVAGERILRYWKTGNDWRYSVKTRQVL
jgi:hypothetical protein